MRYSKGLNRAAARQRTTQVEAGGRDWIVERTADLEEMWAAMEEGDFGEDERLPYWAALWPAGLYLAGWLWRNQEEVRGRRCLDVGCGLGLTAVVGQAAGGQVLGMDYEWWPLAYAARNAVHNDAPGAVFVQMDWRFPALVRGSFDLIWAGDILYEKRFFEPVSALFEYALAPGGRIVVGEAARDVSSAAWERFGALGWSAKVIERGTVDHEHGTARASIRELIREA
jgi:predicted nicotinamide N-methyase